MRQFNLFGIIFTFDSQLFQFKDNKLIVPYSREYAKDHDKITITVPPVLKDKKVKDKEATRRKYKGFIVDNASLEEIMLFYIKGGSVE